MARRASSSRSGDVTTLAVDELTEKQAKAEHARLAAEISAHDQRYYQDDAPTVSDADYDALRRRYEAIEARFPGSAHAGKPDAQGRRGAGASPRCATRCRCSRSAMRFSDEEVADFVEPHPPLPAAAGGRDARLHGRAEDRRAVAVAALRGRRTGHRRHPRRRRRGRGRHRQCPHHQGNSRKSSPAETCPRSARCAARST